jgi:hypothetical protein
MIRIESPLITELIAQTLHKAILTILETRFGSVPEDIATCLVTIQKISKLDQLLKLATSCRDLDAFRARLQALAQPGGAKRPRKRKT